MREIKFRVWNKQSREWADFHSYRGELFPDREVYPQIWSLTNPDANDFFEVCQFTCLKDMNGKEIYEGDIVRAYTYFDEDEKELNESTVHKIIWGDDYPAFDMEPAPLEEYNSLQNFASIQPEGEKIEVIGNIYENPELLKEC